MSSAWTPQESSARTTGPQQDRRPRRVHPFNTVTGLAFLAVVAVWLAADQDVLQGREVGRAVAIVLIVLGAAGVAGTLVAGRRARRPLDHPAPDPVAAAADPTADEKEDDDDGPTLPQR